MDLLLWERKGERESCQWSSGERERFGSRCKHTDVGFEQETRTSNMKDTSASIWPSGGVWGPDSRN